MRVDFLAAQEIEIGTGRTLGNLIQAAVSYLERFSGLVFRSLVSALLNEGLGFD
jgi:hypothetical protein